MKMYQVYVCEVCGKESKYQEDIELCQAKHIGLNSIKDYHAYNALKGLAAFCTAEFANRSNDQVREAEEKAYKDLFRFEKEHNMTV